MSISNDAVEQMIKDAMPSAEVAVNGDGYKYEARVVSDEFDGLSTLKRHQKIYSAVNSAISSGELHALTIKTYTPDEWEMES